MISGLGRLPMRPPRLKAMKMGIILMLLREFSAASQCTDLQIRAIEAVTSFVTSFQSSGSYGASQPRGRW